MHLSEEKIMAIHPVTLNINWEDAQSLIAFIMGIERARHSALKGALHYDADYYAAKYPKKYQIWRTKQLLTEGKRHAPI